ncbi:transposase IS66 family protein [Escherichia coli 8-415-05_S4_C1]|nr:transposase IS66 family protein [Escherichia coli 8-415-05_S4_C2]KEJ17140.1 transposase IS66 family protein [Escherichia coli 8-415-05_S4_C1]KEN35807.1 transposase IS66 family protein [Escherichia coli 8-415-05_S3_C3]KEN45259.1 transposase IS66 family protein [Escherichia coli 8-415-05_S3_C1]KEN77872.1 transposase IS66 family protein [Escherichia coli 8-415-05_S3_C2]
MFTGKYCEPLPLYRQSEIFARQGVELSRALLSNWVDACCQLMTPLNDALYRYVMNTRKLHTDDTPVKVLAPGLKKTKTGRIWTYVRDDRNAGSSSPPAVWFAYSPNRQGKHPEQHLRPFRGILQADAFTGYDRLFSAEREGGALTEVACCAHARRKIHDVYISSKSAMAEEALKRISELYAIEDEIRGLPESERLAVRQQRSKALLTSLHEWMVEKNGTLSKKSRLGEAFSYVLNQWDALCYYRDDGLAEADNNTAERALRAVCLGKKNSYDLCQILSPKRPYAAPGASLYRGLKNLKQSDCILDFTNSYDLCQILSPKRPYAAPGASLYRGLKNLKQSDCILDFTNSYDLCQILSPKRPYAAPGASLYRGLKNLKQSDCILDFTNSYDLCQILSPKRPYAAPGASLYRGLKNLKQSDCILDFTNSYSGILAP